jgi:hypothetical protein
VVGLGFERGAAPADDAEIVDPPAHLSILSEQPCPAG